MNTYKYIASFCLACACATVAQADAPSGYYDDCEGKCQSALKSQLHTIIRPHKKISYDGLWQAYLSTDVDDSGRYWVDVYTDNQVSVSTHNGMNREHSFPKSWWGGNKNEAYSDIVHLMPVNEWANNQRSNYPYGEVDPELMKEYHKSVTNPTYKFGGPVAGQGGGSSYVFEPADEYKGDLARTYFYMVTCYQDFTWSDEGLRTAAQGIYPTLQPWAMELLLRWHREDPVSEKERKRNEGVYTEQYNRNPFIDYPEMVEHIWGNKKDVAWSFSKPVEPVDPAELTSPINDDVYTFTATEPGAEHTRIIPVLGTGITGNVIAKISGPDADKFAIIVGTAPLQTIALNAGDVTSQQGASLTVRYLPGEATDIAPHAATLTLTNKGLEAPVEVRLEGTCAASSVEMPAYSPKADDIYFTIDGRRLPAAPSTPGVYIVVTDSGTYKYIAR